MDINQASIELRNLEVEYVDFGRSFFKPLGMKVNFTALKDINFSANDGDNIALLGRNGAGKTTLLRCIAGLLRPIKGEILTLGRVTLLSGSNPGFIHNISGKRNVYELSGAYGILQNNKQSFIKSVDEFANLGEAFDRNFAGYSAGMKGKLGFGFITGLKPDILLIDETLGVGDREFRAKAQIRLKDFINRSGTVIISTHSLGLAKEICNRGIVLDKGCVVFDGEINEAINHYISMTN